MDSTCEAARLRDVVKAMKKARYGGAEFSRLST